MTDLLHCDQLIESVDESDVLLGMLRPAGTFHPTSVLVEAIWNEVTHPRWPPHTKDPEGKDIGGQFMRAGETFMADGHRWDIHSIADGRIIANEASGNVDSVETRVFTPKELEFADGVHPSLEGATYAPPVKLTAGKQESMAASYNAPVVDADLNRAQPHDPSIELPAGSPLSAEDWLKFPLPDQLYYREVMARYGPWKNPGGLSGSGPQKAKANAVFVKAKKEFGSSDAVDVVKSAFSSQKGSSAGNQLNLASLFSHLSDNPEGLAVVQKKYAHAREVQSDLNGVVAYDLYNRLKSPDISLRHKAPNDEGFFGQIVKGKSAVMSGLSTAWTTAWDWGDSNTLGMAVPIRHLSLAVDVTGDVYGLEGEHEFATADRLKLSPEMSAFWSKSQVPENASNPIWKWLKSKMDTKPAPGEVMKALAAQLSGKADLPGIEQELNFVKKPHIANLKKAVIPPDDFMKHVEDEIAKDPGKALTGKDPVSTLDLKPGDIIQGNQEGLRFMVVDNPGAGSGVVTYVALGKGAPGNYSSSDKLYQTSGSRYKIDKHFDLPVQKAVNVAQYNPDQWVPGGDAVKIGSMAVGTKLRIPDDKDQTGDWEITNSSSTQVLVKSLTGEDEATINPLFKIQPLVRVGGDSAPVRGALMKFQNMIVQIKTKNDDDTWKAVSPQGSELPSLSASQLSPLPNFKPDLPQKGDSFASHGKKYVVTTVLKDGTVKAKPTGGKVESFAKDHPALQGLLRASDFSLGDKSKLKDMGPGDVFSGSTSTVRPYMLLQGKSLFGKTLKAKNLDTGEVMDLSPNKSYPKLVSLTSQPAEEDPKEWGTIDPVEHALNLGDSLAGKTYGDLEIGDQFSIGPATFTILGTPGGVSVQKATATSPPIPKGLGSSLPSLAVYAGHVQQPGVATPAPSTGPNVGDELMNGLVNLHPGAVFKASNNMTYQVVADQGSMWKIKVLGSGAGPNGSPFSWQKNALAGGGTFYMGDQPIHDDDDGSSKQAALAQLVSTYKAAQTQTVSDAEPEKDAVLDGNYQGFKLAKNHGKPHDTIGDMPADAVFADAKGKWWKKLSGDATTENVITDGTTKFKIASTQRGKLAEHTDKTAPDIENPTGDGPQAAEPQTAYPQVSNDEFKVGNVVANPANGVILHVVSDDGTAWTVDDVGGDGKDGLSMEKGGSASWNLLGSVPVGSEPAPEPPAQSSQPGEKVVGQSYPLSAMQVGDQFKIGSHTVVLTKAAGSEGYVNWEDVDEPGNEGSTHVDNALWQSLIYKGVSPQPGEMTAPEAAPLKQTGDLFRASSTYSVPADMPPFSFVKWKNSIYYKNSPVLSTDPSKWFKIGGSKPTTIPNAATKKLYPIVPDPAAFKATSEQVALKDVPVGDVIATSKNPSMFMMLGGAKQGVHLLKLDDGHVYFMKKLDFQVLKTEPVNAPEPEPEIATAPDPEPDPWAAGLPKGFSPAPPGANPVNSGLKVGDQFVDNDDDLHTVLAVDEDKGVQTKYSPNLAPNWWNTLPVKAIKHARESKGGGLPKDADGFRVLPEPVKLADADLKKGDQFKDTDGDVHTVVEAGSETLKTTWHHGESSENGPLAWSTKGNPFKVMAIKKANGATPTVVGPVELTPGQSLDDVDSSALVPGDVIKTTSGSTAYVKKDSVTGKIMLTTDLSMKGFPVSPGKLSNFIYVGKIDAPEPEPDVPAGPTKKLADMKPGDVFGYAGNQYKIDTIDGSHVMTTNVVTGDPAYFSKASQSEMAVVSSATPASPASAQPEPLVVGQKYPLTQFEVGDLFKSQQFAGSGGDTYQITSTGLVNVGFTNLTTGHETNQSYSATASAQYEYAGKADGPPQIAPAAASEQPATPEPTAAASPVNPDEATDGIPDYSGTYLQQTGTLPGSNSPLKMKDLVDQPWLVKPYGGNQDRIATELLANALYRRLGLKAANAGAYTLDNGERALAYPLAKGTPQNFSQDGPSAKKTNLGKGFMADVLLANRDFAGLEDDNVLWNGDEPTRIDQGASFFYRAQGQKKSFDASPAVDLKNFLTIGQGKNGVTVTEQGLRNQATKIADTLDKYDIDALVDQAGFEDKQMSDDVAGALWSRVQWMKQFGAGDVAMPSGTGIAPGTQAGNPKKIGTVLKPATYDDLPTGTYYQPETGLLHDMIMQKGPSGKDTVIQDPDNVWAPGESVTMSSGSIAAFKVLTASQLPDGVNANPSDPVRAPATPGVPAEADLPIKPYLHHKGGKTVYSELSTLEPGQVFADKQGKKFMVLGTNIGMSHVGTTPADLPNGSTYAQSLEGTSKVTVSHSFVGAAGAQAGKTLPTRVKLIS